MSDPKNLASKYVNMVDEKYTNRRSLMIKVIKNVPLSYCGYVSKFQGVGVAIKSDMRGGALVTSGTQYLRKMDYWRKIYEMVKIFMGFDKIDGLFI